MGFQGVQNRSMNFQELSAFQTFHEHSRGFHGISRVFQTFKGVLRWVTEVCKGLQGVSGGSMGAPWCSEMF